MLDKLTDADLATIAAYKGSVTVIQPGDTATRPDEWHGNKWFKQNGKKNRPQTHFGRKTNR